MKKLLAQSTFIAIIIFATLMQCPPVSFGEALIIDHTCTDISPIPETWIAQSKSMFRVTYGHTSHGSQIVTGMTILQNYDSLYSFNSTGSGGALLLHDGYPAGDLGNPDRSMWAQRTRDLLNTPGNVINMVMWSWCGQADATSEEIQLYLDLMSGLVADYPNVTFIYMTGHLTGTGEQGNLHQRNNQIRQHVIANDGVLFDFADIESYDPDGNCFLDLNADDGCSYTGGNWAIEWCAANPGHELCEPCGCAHSESLNCNLKGRAFWWMMARLAGWNPGGNPDDLDGDGIVNADDNCPNTPNGPTCGTCVEESGGLMIGRGQTCTNSTACGSQGVCDMAKGDCNGNGIGDACECYADTNGDGKIILSDLVNLKTEFGRTNCSTPPPCVADMNDDGQVILPDLVILKSQFGRTNCLTP